MNYKPVVKMIGRNIKSNMINLWKAKELIKRKQSYQWEEL